MGEYRRELRDLSDAEGVAGAIYAALAEVPTPPRFELAVPDDPGITERWSGPAGTGLRLRETWAWQVTRDVDEMLGCTARVWDADVAGGGFVLAWWASSIAARLRITGDAAAIERGVDALYRALGQSADELDVLDVLAGSAAFAVNVHGRPAARLAYVRYDPSRLTWQRVSDDRATLAALERIAAADPDLGAAPLVAALLHGLVGRLDKALAVLDAALARPRATADLALCRADVLSRLGLAADARAALPALSPDDPLAPAAAELAAAIDRRT